MSQALSTKRECAMQEFPDEPFIFLEPAYLDDAIMGVSADSNPVVVYNVQKLILLIEINEGMTYEEAMEWVDYNILGAYLGDKNPMYVWRIRC